MATMIPPQFAQNYHDMYGEAGDRWIAALPGLVRELEEEWGIEVGEPYPLSYNWVAPATRRVATAARGGEPVVLKAGMPTDSEIDSEMVSLLAFHGRGIARLLEHSLERGVMLLEKVEPGTPLVDVLDEIGDDGATRIAGEVMRELWAPVPEEGRDLLITTQRWGEGFANLRREFGGGTGLYPSRIVERAERIWAALEASPASEPVLMHGDLHHWNILDASGTQGAGSGWLAIDPKGLVAEPAYEPGALLRNPWPGPEDVPTLLRALPRRVDILCEVAGLDRQRVLAWSFAQAVLSEWWNYESFGKARNDTMIAFAEGHEALLDGNWP